MRTFTSRFEWEILGARDSVNHGISITSRPDEKTVAWERKSALEREADVFLRSHGVKGLRVASERRHDRARGSSVITEAAKSEIVAAYKEGETQTAIGRRYGVSRRLIFNVIKAGVK